MIKHLLNRLALASALLAGGAMADPIAYVVHGGGNVGAAQGGVVGSIDLATGTYTALTPSLGSLTGLVYKDGSLFAYEVQGNRFLEIDPSTGAVLSSVVRSGGSAPTDMALNPVSGEVYSAGTDFSLYRVDLVTGVLTYIGYLEGGGGFRAIAFDDAGVLYMNATNGPGDLRTVDPATGAILGVIPGGVPGGALGLGFEPESGLLIASECCYGSDGSLGERLYSVDPATGASNLLYDYNDGRRIHDIAFEDALPPTSANLRLSFSGPRTPIRSGAATQAYARLDNYGPDAARSPVLALDSNAPASAIQVIAPSGWNCISATSGSVAIECRYIGDFARGTVLFPLKVIPPRSMADGVIAISGSVSSRSLDPMTNNDSASISLAVRPTPISPTDVGTTTMGTTKGQLPTGNATTATQGD